MFPIKDNIPSHSVPFVNWMLILANCGAFAVQIWWAHTLPQPRVEALIYQFGLVPALYTYPSLAEQIYPPWMDVSVWRIYLFPFVSYMFMHGGIFHLLLNMVSLFVFGDNVEDRLGHTLYLLFYLLGGIAAVTLHLLMHSTSSIPIVGASGAIAAVMGAYMLMFPRAQVLTLVPIFCLLYFINIPAVLFLGFWFFLQIMSGMGSLGANEAQGIAWWAHIGGFAFGILTALLLGNQKRKGPAVYEPVHNRRRSIVPLRSYRSRIDI